MPHTIDWLVEDRVVLIELSGETTIEELRELAAKHNDYLEQGVPLVHTITDIGAVHKYPQDMREVRALFKPATGDNAGWLLVCGASNPLMRFITSVISQLVFPGGRFRMLASRQDAVEFLRKHDETLRNSA